jgi:hypothetical protein
MDANKCDVKGEETKEQPSGGAVSRITQTANCTHKESHE